MWPLRYLVWAFIVRLFNIAELIHFHIQLWYTFKKGSKFPCPECGKKSNIHDTIERNWRHLNFFQYRAYIHAKMPRTKCRDHGVLQVKAPWAEPGSEFTMLF